jgi:hypothetical protein
MNNEPVAYVSEEDLRDMETHLCNLHLKPKDKDIPLYTHPVKELTDEEILQFQDKVPYTLGSDLIEFARAILRKAQEK